MLCNQWNHTLPGGRSIVWFEVLQVLLERDAECVYIVTDMKGSELRSTWDDVIPEMGCYFRDEPKPQPLHWVFSITLSEQTQLFSNHQTWLSVNMVKQGFTVYMYKTLWIRYEAKIATLEDATITRFPALHRCAGWLGCSARSMVMIGRLEAKKSVYICLYQQLVLPFTSEYQPSHISP